ncbi:DEKNAAC104700 [Brettanomyces naardenensis]|uniref:DEKNAAC104700 n=1 Tax=Brettanomyces naardenensis TaxID=13370 RepID=A0A448YR17_BRENA|nr:DEKNAAC104700 [Brettanomyces naardenensis]
MSLADPKRIIEMQKFYQTSTKPIWRAHPRAKLYLIPYFAAFGISVGASLTFLVRAVLDIKAKK